MEVHGRRHLARTAETEVSRIVLRFRGTALGRTISGETRAVIIFCTSCGWRSSQIDPGLEHVLEFRKGNRHGEWNVGSLPSLRKATDLWRQVERRKILELDKDADRSKA